METILGALEPPFSVIASISILRVERKPLPVGEGPISFGGFNWVGWRTGFEVRGDRVVTLPRAAEGFRYGHGGHGRGGMLYTNIYVDGDLLVEVEDPEMHQEYDGVHLGYGGIGVEWLWENMGWISDFSATAL